MKKIGNGLVVIESLADIEVLYAKGELENDSAFNIFSMVQARSKYCISDDFWRTLKSKIDLRSHDRSILCILNRELVRISYSDPQSTIPIIAIEKAKIYGVDELE